MLEPTPETDGKGLVTLVSLAFFGTFAAGYLAAIVSVMALAARNRRRASRTRNGAVHVPPQ